MTRSETRGLEAPDPTLEEELRSRLNDVEESLEKWVRSDTDFVTEAASYLQKKWTLTKEVDKVRADVKAEGGLNPGQDIAINASHMPVPQTSGPLYCRQAPLILTPRLTPHSTCKAFCAATMI